MSRRDVALLALVFCALALVIYAPALQGGLVSDDYGYVGNVYIQSLDTRTVLSLLDPFGAPALYTANYAPVHLLAHAVEWVAFGEETVGYHIVNVLLHGIASALLAVLFARSGIPRRWSVALAALFLVHPANVEAVAWIFQLKSPLALALSVAALIVFPRRSVLALVLFTLAILSKFSAAYALPVAALRLSRAPDRPRRAWVWLGAWTVSLAYCALPEFTAFDRLGRATVLAPYPDLLVHARSIAAYAARYLVMAETSLGVSAFQEPPLARSWTDSWWLAGIVVLGVAGVRFVIALGRRSEEAAYWGWAAAAWIPVSQLFPFLYPMGDRYLYFILPGLLGAAWFWAADALAAIGGPVLRTRLERAARGALLLIVLVFACRSYDRAGIWRSELTVTLDAARHYPEGSSALFLSARSAAQTGHFDAAFADLDQLATRGYDGFLMVQGDPGLAPLANDPRFAPVLARFADNWIRVVEPRKVLIQPDLRMLGLAYLVRGDRQAAARAMERALAMGGPFDETIRGEMQDQGLDRGGSGGSEEGAPDRERGDR